MDDQKIVAGVRRGERDALAALYGRYADVLHDFARRRVHSQADASDVVHDTFLVAVERIGQLRDPERLRPWLYAIARTELHRKYRRAARYVELDTQDERREPVSREPGPDVLVERAELVELLRAATAGLADADRELLDLHLRHGLVGADLAAAAGIPPRHASVALERVKDRLTRTLGVVLLSRQPVCEEFVAIRDALPGLSPLARKRLARHVDDCEVCSDEQRRRLRPEVLLSAVPMLPAPPELRYRLMSSQNRQAPGGQFWDGEGFPWPSDPRSRRWPVWAAAAVAVLLLIGGTVLITRPLLAERAVATESPTSLGPATASPSEASAVAGAVLSGSAIATTTSSTTTTTRRTTTPPATPPPDTAPPQIGNASLSPTWFCALVRGKPTCEGAPNPIPTKATVSATVLDPSGVATVTLTWAGSAGSGGSATMRAGSGGVYTAEVGPVDGANLACGTYDISITIVATDERGNTTERTTAYGGAVHRC
jgi:RNA polymerase sigma factor (sigma-70 family)